MKDLNVEKLSVLAPMFTKGKKNQDERTSSYKKG
jgi:hypothetical protein